MRRLYVVVEGQTEQEFVIVIIAPYFRIKGFYDIRALLIRTSRTGRSGFVNYQHLKNDITRLLKHEQNIIVTTFIDYFRIPTNVPDYKECIEHKTNPINRVTCLEDNIKTDINDRRFIPYIQLHEFEALLFSSNKGFEYYYQEEIFSKTQEIIDKYQNPELINDKPQTAPSKRIQEIIPAYNKVFDGNLIAIEVGIPTIMKKCSRFSKWISLIEDKLKE